MQFPPFLLVGELRGADLTFNDLTGMAVVDNSLESPHREGIVLSHSAP